MYGSGAQAQQYGQQMAAAQQAMYMGMPNMMGMGGYGMNMGAMAAMAGGMHGGALPPNFQQGDWMCACGAHNYKSKTHCYQCKQPKPYHLGGGMGGGMGGGLPANFQVGDWMCSCGNHNYASREQCGRCGISKAEGDVTAQGGGAMGGFAGLPGVPANFRPGDWMCPCGNHNYASRQACGRCGQEKPADGGLSHLRQQAASGLPANFRQGDWMCPECNNHNYASKTNCHKCGIPRPVEGEQHQSTTQYQQPYDQQQQQQYVPAPAVPEGVPPAEGAAAVQQPGAAEPSASGEGQTSSSSSSSATSAPDEPRPRRSRSRSPERAGESSRSPFRERSRSPVPGAQE